MKRGPPELFFFFLIREKRSSGVNQNRLDANSEARERPEGKERKKVFGRIRRI